MKGQGTVRWSMGVCAALVMCVAVVATGSVAWSQQEGADAPSKDALKLASDEKAIDVASHNVRFHIKKDWSVQESEGIFFISSKDKKMLMVVVTLDDPREIPTALGLLDQLVPVTGATFGQPRAGGHYGIPSELMFGSGKMQPSGRTVDLLSVTMNLNGKAMLSMFYVHRDMLDTYLPQVERVLQTYAMVMSKKQADAVKKTIDDRSKAKEEEAPKAP